MSRSPDAVHRTSTTSALTLCGLMALLVTSGACSSTEDNLLDGLSAAGGESAAGGASAAGGQGSQSPTGGLGGFSGLDGDAGASGSGGSGSSTDPDAGASGAGSLDPYVLPPNIFLNDAGVALCGSGVCACNNGLDDDGDGKVDGFDEECTGAIDDDEGSFSTGIPGDNSDPKWQDCFYDGNSGAGDDHCRYHVDCLTGAKPSSDPACAVDDSCKDFCEARTPNGCDCFGCCSVNVEGSGSVNVFIGGACNLEQVDNPEVCSPCTPSAACGNDCGECELCAGKGVEDLPESCGASTGGEDPPAYTCDAGQAVCGSDGVCPGGQYCSLGCCLAVTVY